MAIYQLGNLRPDIASSAYVSEHAVLIGDIVIGENVSIWPGAVLRADNARIWIGAGSNIQDGAILHADPGLPLTIGSDVTVGHQAMLHGCTTGDACLIGIQAVVLNGAVIGAQSLVGAGALVPEHRAFEPGRLIVGAPARVVRELDEVSRGLLLDNAASYRHKARQFRDQLVRLA